MRIVILSLAVGWLFANAAFAEELSKSPAACSEVQTCGSQNCCAHCGCHCPCEKYCKIVCEIKDVKKSCWVVKCEDFCAPMPGCERQCCGDCEQRCPETPCCNGGCRKCDPCAWENSKRIVPPNCGKVRERKTLVKQEVICKVPSYKCVVVYCCPQCGCDQQQNPPSGNPTEAAPPPPAPHRALAR